MRKLLIVLFILCLCGCKEETLEDKLRGLGYSEEAIAVIGLLSETDQERFLETYDEKLAQIVLSPFFAPDHLDDYLRYYGSLPFDKMMELVNKDLLNDGNLVQLQELYQSDYYIPENEDLYLNYLGKYETIREMMEIVNTRRYLSYFTDIRETDLSKDTLMLVNKYYSLPSDYEPDDLVQVESDYGKGYIRQMAYEAFKQLHEDALKSGYNIRVVSAYRSYDYQAAVYAKYLRTDPVEVVDTYSARPGLSEHQTGLTADVSIPGCSIDDFYLTEASVWLKENCHRYGFIIRYPEDKPEITGYQWESWHIRYLGKDTATDVYQRGITFDEYYACFIEDHE